MKTYLALLRGINVGGKSLIKMADLKLCFEANGYKNVRTYINSGNVIFEATEASQSKLAPAIERMLTVQFGWELKIVLCSYEQLKKIIKNAPVFWGKDSDYKHNLLFIRPPMTAKEALAECGKPKPEFEQAVAGDGVIYVSSSIPHIMKTTFVKLASKPIYQHMTIRNYNTSTKLLNLMGGDRD